MSSKKPQRTTPKSGGQNQPSSGQQAASQSGQHQKRGPRPKGWKGITPANRLLVVIGAVGALSAAIYACAFVYQVYRQEQQSTEAKRAVIGVRLNTDEVAERRIRFSFEIFNKGVRKLANLKYCILSDPKRSESHSLSDCQPESITTQGPFAVLPNDSWMVQASVDDDRIPLVRNRQLYFFVVGAVYYQESEGQKTIPFCGVYDEGFKRIGDCMSVSSQH
jgi:hypothetical protein